MELPKLQVVTPGALENVQDEEPVTPASRLFIQPDFYTVVLCVVGFERAIEISSFKQELLNTFAKHPRFSSILVSGTPNGVVVTLFSQKTSKNGKDIWVRTQLNVNDHVQVVELKPEEHEFPNFIEEYTAKLADAKPFDISKPLWEIHILNYRMVQDAASVCIFRFHHAIGDGTSIMSLFLASTRQLENPDSLPTIPGKMVSLHKTAGILDNLWRCCLLTWFSAMEIWKFAQMQLWQSDSHTKLTGQKGAESWPKSFAVVSLSLDDMKLVKGVTGSTINDVLLAVISNAIRLYLKHHSDDARNLQNLRVRALVMKNTRPTPGVQELAAMMEGHHSKARWGNNMGYLLVPLSLENFSDPLEHVRRAKACSYRKKHSLEANFTYASGAFLIQLLGPKGGVDVTYKSTMQTTVTVSNMMGPNETVTFAGNPITFIVPTSSGLPQAFLIHMASYRGQVKIGLMAKKDLVPDVDFLAKCFQDAMKELKHAAL